MSNHQGSVEGHTAGPWGYWPHYSGAEEQYVVGPGNYETVADVRQGCGEVTGNPLANARLIAAAPELYEALKAADEALAQFTAFEDDARYIMGNTNFEVVKQRRAQVKAALSKAGGAA
jgi:hypothetical protein